MSWDAHVTRLGLQPDIIYNVVRSKEGLFAVWPANQPLPTNWSATGKSGTNQVCIAFLKELWPEFDVNVLRKRMEEMSKLPLQP